MSGVVAVLRNPTAGRGKHRHGVTAAIASLTSAGHTVKMLDANSRDEADAVCRHAVGDGAAALVVAGGDGTVHIGLQAVAGTGVGFGVIPTGTGNDFARAVGVPIDPARAGHAAAQALDQGRRRVVDLARMSTPDGYRQWFGAVLAAGFDALVNERANAMRWPKGRRRYDIATFVELLGLRARRYRVTLDGQVLEQAANLVAVGNAPCYGGGLRMCPDADLTDGLLDVVVGGPISRLTLLRLYPKVFQGTHVDHPKVTSYRAGTVTIEADGIIGYADGERTRALPLTVTAEPGALRVLV
ncbi:MAG TPA: diacylglycerol kinase family protein [Micromonosporaceae bacterium]